MGSRHVAAAARADGERRTRASGRTEHETMADDRRRNDLVRASAAAPQFAAAIWSVRVHTVLTVYDDLVVITRLNGDRRTPAGTGVARSSPDLPTGARLEGGNERSGELILIQDDAIAVQQR